jgi:hypothetical protein
MYLRVRAQLVTLHGACVRARAAHTLGGSPTPFTNKGDLAQLVHAVTGQAFPRQRYHSCQRPAVQNDRVGLTGCSNASLTGSSNAPTVNTTATAAVAGKTPTAAAAAVVLAGGGNGSSGGGTNIAAKICSNLARDFGFPNIYFVSSAVNEHEVDYCFACPVAAAGSLQEHTTKIGSPSATSVELVVACLRRARTVRQIANSGPLLASPVPALVLLPLKGLLIRSMKTSTRRDLPVYCSSRAHTTPETAKFPAHPVKREDTTDNAPLAAVLHLEAQTPLPWLETFPAHCVREKCSNLSAVPSRVRPGLGGRIARVVRDGGHGTAALQQLVPAAALVLGLQLFPSL